NQAQLAYVHPLNNNGERHQRLTDFSESSDALISSSQSICDFMSQPLGLSLIQDELNLLESNESPFTNTEYNTSSSFEHNNTYSLLLDLLNFRDSLCVNKDLTELLFRIKELSVKLDKVSHIDMTEDIRSCILTVIHQM